jgi:hypothetical protein
MYSIFVGTYDEIIVLPIQMELAEGTHFNGQLDRFALEYRRNGSPDSLRFRWAAGQENIDRDHLV